MRRLLLLLVLSSAGCSNAPLAGFLDTVHPSRGKVEPNPREQALPPPLIEAPRN